MHIIYTITVNIIINYNLLNYRKFHYLFVFRIYHIISTKVLIIILIKYTNKIAVLNDNSHLLTSAYECLNRNGEDTCYCISQKIVQYMNNHLVKITNVNMR